AWHHPGNAGSPLRLDRAHVPPAIHSAGTSAVTVPGDGPLEYPYRVGRVPGVLRRVAIRRPWEGSLPDPGQVRWPAHDHDQYKSRPHRAAALERTGRALMRPGARTAVRLRPRG